MLYTLCSTKDVLLNDSSSELIYKSTVCANLPLELNLKTANNPDLNNPLLVTNIYL